MILVFTVGGGSGEGDIVGLISWGGDGATQSELKITLLRSDGREKPTVSRRGQVAMNPYTVSLGFGEVGYLELM
jgi:hypothetical protein